MKILYLPLKKEWYEMIEAGIKPEEYRERTDYWKSRLCAMAGTYICKYNGMSCQICTQVGCLKDFDAVCFSYGYTKRKMLLECKGVSFGQGRKEWGAPDHKTYIIKLGERIDL